MACRLVGVADGGVQATVRFPNPAIDPECAAIPADIPAEAKAVTDLALAMAATCASARAAGAIASPVAAISGMGFKLQRLRSPLVVELSFSISIRQAV